MTTEEKQTTEEVEKEKKTTGKKKQTLTEEEEIITEEKQTSPKKGKPRKSYSILTKTEINEIITRKINGEKIDVAKEYKQSKQTETKINSLLNKSWRNITENDAVPNGYFNPNSTKKKIVSVLYDKGFVLN